MADAEPIQVLLEEALNSGRTPEDVCGARPELLTELRERLRRIRHLSADIESAFPSSSRQGVRRHKHGATREGERLPQIPGYELEAAVGYGGMGVVYKARHVGLDRSVAIKMLLSGDYASEKQLAALVREAKAVAALKHIHIVQVYDVGELDGLPYFTMEFVGGGSLAQKLDGKPLAARAAAALVATLAEAVQAAHSGGVVHRDLKPANILLASDNTPKITDFGLARRTAGDPGLTLSDARVGTPSYMAPEQVIGSAGSFGPAVDIYALGAILYETLTGRPPFRADSPAETQKQVVAEEPAPPRRLNARVPRDVETICLKCLHKHPPRRYASPGDLAADLTRWLSGRPILARPVGPVERCAKWTRRRPASAMLAAAMLALLAMAIAGGVWRRSIETDRRAELALRQARAGQAVEIALARADELREREGWPEGLRILDDAATRLPEVDSEILQLRVEQARADFHLADDLEHVRQNGFNQGAREDRAPKEAVANGYAACFARIGVKLDDDMHSNAQRIHASVMRAQLLAALDDWALAANALTDHEMCNLLLSIAREADPDPAWRDRFRNAAVWRDRQQLLTLADEISESAARPASHQIALLGMLLGWAGAPAAGAELLGDVLRQQPNNFWINLAVGNTLRQANRHAEASIYYRIAAALRPDNMLAHNALAIEINETGDIDESVRIFQKAIDLEPGSHIPRHNLVWVLSHNGRWKDARVECGRAIEAQVQSQGLLKELAAALLSDGKFAEAIEPLERALELEPDRPEVRDALGECLLKLLRFDEAEVVFRETIRVHPDRAGTYYLLGTVYREAKRVEDALREFQTSSALGLPTAQNAILQSDMGNLLLLCGRAEDATAAFQSAIKADSNRFADRIGLASALLALGRFSEARAAAAQGAGVAGPDNQRLNAGQMAALCGRLAALHAESPAIDSGADPSGAAAIRDVAEWNWKYRRLAATAARQYAAAFADAPSLLDDPKFSDRFDAACAAVAAACLHDPGSADLTAPQRESLRRQALAWLSAEHDSWAARHQSGERTLAARTMRAWLRDGNLSPIRGQDALTDLPSDERSAWRNLWNDVDRLATLDPETAVTNARLLGRRGQWSDAVKEYARALEMNPSLDAEIWFEYAATQQLAGDRDEYEHTCSVMLDRCGPAGPMRSFLVARASTLDSDLGADAARAARLSDKELRDNPRTHWSLTQQAALQCRAGNWTEAIPLFEQSIAVSPKSGAAVVNWAWLALANKHAGNVHESRRWLAKAHAWLDPLHGEMPPNSGDLELHLHNWFEAQILLKQADSQF
ncbi:hypothetical protein BH11PLA1_BH11PLA1_04930 [soil metagenome]